ncbi:unnamed protein product [Amoebophrya sp. A120]|nr:unnamed protein product [Amoebophrya sp. A120]|eukprot:GSA120T00016665001.1
MVGTRACRASRRGCLEVIKGSSLVWIWLSASGTIFTSFLSFSRYTTGAAAVTESTTRGGKHRNEASTLAAARDRRLVIHVGNGLVRPDGEYWDTDSRARSTENQWPNKNATVVSDPRRVALTRHLQVGPHTLQCDIEVKHRLTTNANPRTTTKGQSQSEAARVELQRNTSPSDETTDDQNPIADHHFRDRGRESAQAGTSQSELVRPGTTVTDVLGDESSTSNTSSTTSPSRLGIQPVKEQAEDATIPVPPPAPPRNPAQHHDHDSQDDLFKRDSSKLYPGLERYIAIQHERDREREQARPLSQVHSAALQTEAHINSGEETQKNGRDHRQRRNEPELRPGSSSKRPDKADKLQLAVPEPAYLRELLFAKIKDFQFINADGNGIAFQGSTIQHQPQQARPPEKRKKTEEEELNDLDAEDDTEDSSLTTGSSGGSITPSVQKEMDRQASCWRLGKEEDGYWGFTLCFGDEVRQFERGNPLAAGYSLGKFSAQIVTVHGVPVPQPDRTDERGGSDTASRLADEPRDATRTKNTSWRFLLDAVLPASDFYSAEQTGAAGDEPVPDRTSHQVDGNKTSTVTSPSLVLDHLPEQKKAALADALQRGAATLSLAQHYSGGTDGRETFVLIDCGAELAPSYSKVSEPKPLQYEIRINSPSLCSMQDLQGFGLVRYLSTFPSPKQPAITRVGSADPLKDSRTAYSHLKVTDIDDLDRTLSFLDYVVAEAKQNLFADSKDRDEAGFSTKSFLDEGAAASGSRKSTVRSETGERSAYDASSAEGEKVASSRSDGSEPSNGPKNLLESFTNLFSNVHFFLWKAPREFFFSPATDELPFAQSTRKSARNKTATAPEVDAISGRSHEEMEQERLKERQRQKYENTRQLRPSMRLFKESLPLSLLLSNHFGQCLDRNEGWWSYQYCFPHGMRQFHAAQAQHGLTIDANGAVVTQENLPNSPAASVEVAYSLGTSQSILGKIFNLRTRLLHLAKKLSFPLGASQNASTFVDKVPETPDQYPKTLRAAVNMKPENPRLLSDGDSQIRDPETHIFLHVWDKLQWYFEKTHQRRRKKSAKSKESVLNQLRQKNWQVYDGNLVFQSINKTSAFYESSTPYATGIKAKDSFAGAITKLAKVYFEEIQELTRIFSLQRFLNETFNEELGLKINSESGSMAGRRGRVVSSGQHVAKKTKQKARSSTSSSGLSTSGAPSSAGASEIEAENLNRPDAEEILEMIAHFMGLVFHAEKVWEVFGEKTTTGPHGQSHLQGVEAGSAAIRGGGDDEESKAVAGERDQRLQYSGWTATGAPSYLRQVEYFDHENRWKPGEFLQTYEGTTIDPSQEGITEAVATSASTSGEVKIDEDSAQKMKVDASKKQKFRKFLVQKLAPKLDMGVLGIVELMRPRHLAELRIVPFPKQLLLSMVSNTYQHPYLDQWRKTPKLYAAWQRLTDGTPCEETGKARETEIFFMCPPVGQGGGHARANDETEDDQEGSSGGGFFDDLKEVRSLSMSSDHFTDEDHEHGVRPQHVDVEDPNLHLGGAPPFTSSAHVSPRPSIATAPAAPEDLETSPSKRRGRRRRRKNPWGTEAEMEEADESHTEGHLEENSVEYFDYVPPVLDAETGRATASGTSEDSTLRTEVVNNEKQNTGTSEHGATHSRPQRQLERRSRASSDPDRLPLDFEAQVAQWREVTVAASSLAARPGEPVATNSSNRAARTGSSAASASAKSSKRPRRNEFVHYSGLISSSPVDTTRGSRSSARNRFIQASDRRKKLLEKFSAHTRGMEIVGLSETLCHYRMLVAAPGLCQHPELSTSVPAFLARTPGHAEDSLSGAAGRQAVSGRRKGARKGRKKKVNVIRCSRTPASHLVDAEEYPV